MNGIKNLLSANISLTSIALFMYIMGSYTSSMLGWNTLLIRVPLYAFVGISLMRVIMRKDRVNKFFVVWYSTFCCICLMSLLYTQYFSTGTEILSFLLTAYVFGVCISSYLYHDERYVVIKYGYIITSVLVGMQLILNFQQANWWSRLGENFGMNENMVGLYFLIPLCFSFDELVKKKHTALNIVTILVDTYTMMLTGSKKSLFAAVIFIIVYSYCMSERFDKKLISSICIIGILLVVYNLVMKIELLYNILGYRIEQMFNTIQNESYTKSGGSTAERGDMILFAMKTSTKSPIIGFGINSFKEIYGAYAGHYAYAHNNYAELMVDLGVIGLMSYYSIHIVLLKKFSSLSIIARKRNSGIISFLVLLLFYDVAMVTYYDPRMIMLIAVMCSKALPPYKQSYIMQEGNLNE